MMFRCVAFCIAALLILSAGSAGAATQSQENSWQIELDAPREVRPLLEKHLDIYRYRGRPEVDAELLDRLVARTAGDARQLLSTEGYFSPTIEVSRTGDQDAGVVRLRVKTGTRATVSTADIVVGGAIADDPGENVHRMKIIGAWRLPPGSAFRQETWDGAKDALLRELQFDGYPAARIAASEAEADPQTDRVSVAVRIDSGPLFRFGSLEINGLQRYPQSIVENLSRIPAGARYNYDEVLQYQAALQGSGYFQNASVTVETDTARAAAAPIVVRVVEYPAMKVDLGVGYSTDSGFRSEATYTHNNTLRPGWQGLARLRLDEKKQTLETGLAFLPEASGWRNHIGAEVLRSDIENLMTSNQSLAARRTWQSPEKEHDWTLKFQIEEQSIEAGPVDNLQALSLNYSWTRRRVDDLLRPKRGHLLNLQLGGAAEALLSTRSFVRGYGRGLYIQPLGKTDRVHLRGEFGAVWADARDGIPNEFLFRAGGDQSVRGYAYQSLGVAQNGAIVGGRYLGVASVEYQHDFTSVWGGALFVDAGNAADTLSRFRPVYGYGVGVRWYTLAGSINFDIARAQETGRFRLHFTIGARF